MGEKKPSKKIIKIRKNRIETEFVAIWFPKNETHEETIIEPTIWSRYLSYGQFEAPTTSVVGKSQRRRKS